MASSIPLQVETAFHTLEASRITLHNNNKTAKRNYKEHNHGVVFSSSPLHNNRIFRVQIDKKVTNKTGNIEIGIITCEPGVVEMTGSASSIINGAWVLAGNLILRNGTPCMHIANKDLNDLNEGESCGVMRTHQGELLFEVNGECIGIIAQNLPPRIYAVVDLNGKCIQATLQPTVVQLTCPQHNGDKTRSCPVLTPNVPYFSNLQLCPDLNVCVTLPSYRANGQGAIPKDKNTKNNKLRFHQHCGNLVKLSSDRKTAERRDPLDEFNNGVVMTHRTLYDDELFEIRIDHLVNKWSGSLEVGVTTHNPLLIEFPTTMTNMHSGTIMMSGCGILINGKGTTRKYGQYNLDKLRESDRVGMMRKSNGNLHYFINGLDQGVAASKIPQHVWGVIDLYGMTIKVTIIDSDERKNQNLVPQRKSSQSNILNYGETSRRNNISEAPNSDRLLFHPNCGAHAVVSNGGSTAHRPRANDDFNNGVVLTNRPLHSDEMFEVRLDKVVEKWAGSIEIGVTTHAATELDFPITMTNMRTGTWMMTENGVMHNGTTVQDRYGSGLDRIIVGDRVGVVRQSCGTLRFYINGIDQGPAVTNVPDEVYGVIDLYGQAAQASIVQFPNSPESLPSSISNTTLHGGDLCFNRVHGRNVRIRGMGMLAVRLASMVNFEDALVFSSRPLRECEMFQIRVREVLESSDNCIAFGVTAACPNDMSPSTFKGLTQDTYILHKRTLIHNGCHVSDKYPLNLTNITVNSRLGIMRHADRSVHFYLDGMDQGKAWDVYNLNIYAVIDLSGQCSEVSMCPPKSRGYSGNSDNSLNMLTTGLQCSHITKHIFSEYCGTNIEINSDYTIARVISLTTMSNLVFSASLLHPDGLFEVEVLSCDSNFAGSMRIGVTDVNILNAYVNTKLPSSMLDLPAGTMFIEGNQQITVGSNLVNPVYPSICWLKTKDRIGLRRIGYTDCIALQLNTEEIGVIFRNVPDKVFVVFELCGPQTSIRAISTETFPCAESEMEASDDGNSLHLIGCTSPVQTDRINDNDNLLMVDSPDQASLSNVNNNDGKAVDKPFSQHKKTSFFHINHGGNIVIEKHGLGVRRLTGYNRAIVIASKPIVRGQTFKFQITKINPSWSSSIMIGVSKSMLALRLPTSAVDLNQGCWIVSIDHLYLDGNTVWSDYGKPLDSLRNGSTVTLDFTENRELHLIINNVNLGCFARMTQKINRLYPIVDIYGQCEQISILNEDGVPSFDSEQEVDSMSDNISNDTNTCVQPDGVIENNGNDASCYYKTIQLCEKANLEYYEKESSSLDRTNFSFSYSSQPSASCINFQPRNKAKNRLSKSLSENESINLAIQNMSLTDCVNVVNEIRNREIKRRDCPQNITPPHDQGSTFSFGSYDEQFRRNFALQRSTSLQNIMDNDTVIRCTRSLEDLPDLIPKNLKFLFESNYLHRIWHMSTLNNSLIKYWKLWELWKQCKESVLNSENDDEGENSTEINSRQLGIRNSYLKDSYRMIFNKCRGQLVESVRDVYRKQCDDAKLTTSQAPFASECILCRLILTIDVAKEFESARSSSFTDDYEYYIRVLLKESPPGYLPGDEFIYYIRELFREEPPVYKCSLLNHVIQIKEGLDLPSFIFTCDPPQCFCNTCCEPEMITDIPNGWVRFFLNKSGCVPPKVKREFNYWLLNIEDVHKLFQVPSEVFITPYERLPAPDSINDSHMLCVDKNHEIGEMKVALQVLVWNLPVSTPTEAYCQSYKIQPLHYHLESVGYCQIVALLMCGAI